MPSKRMQNTFKTGTKRIQTASKKNPQTQKAFIFERQMNAVKNCLSLKKVDVLGAQYCNYLIYKDLTTALRFLNCRPPTAFSNVFESYAKDIPNAVETCTKRPQTTSKKFCPGKKAFIFEHRMNSRICRLFLKKVDTFSN